MLHKTIIKIVLFFILSLYITAFVSGCSLLRKQQPKAIMIVEKPPIRTIYIDYHKDINQRTVDMVMDNFVSMPYQNYKFNPETKVTISYDAEVKSTVSDTVTRKLK
jgi:hypothetical protein